MKRFWCKLFGHRWIPMPYTDKGQSYCARCLVDTSRGWPSTPKQLPPPPVKKIESTVPLQRTTTEPPRRFFNGYFRVTPEYLEHLLQLPEGWRITSANYVGGNVHQLYFRVYRPNADVPWDEEPELQGLYHSERLPCGHDKITCEWKELPIKGQSEAIKTSMAQGSDGNISGKASSAGNDPARSEKESDGKG